MSHNLNLYNTTQRLYCLLVYPTIGYEGEGVTEGATPRKILQQKNCSQKFYGSTQLRKTKIALNPARGNFDFNMKRGLL